MMIFEASQTRALILEEYPFFEGYDLAIARRFQTADGRVFNAFLVESTKPGLERLIAKGVVHQEYGSLETVRARSLLADSAARHLPDGV